LIGFWFGYIFSFGPVTIKEESTGGSKDEIVKENAGGVGETVALLGK
jgi:hypothetical protein